MGDYREVSPGVWVSDTESREPIVPARDRSEQGAAWARDMIAAHERGERIDGNSFSALLLFDGDHACEVMRAVIPGDVPISSWSEVADYLGFEDGDRYLFFATADRKDDTYFFNKSNEEGA